MCAPGFLAALPAVFGGGAAATTAAGAGAGAAAGAGLSTGALLQGAGLALSVGGTLATARQQSEAAKDNARLIEEQRALEAKIAATEDQRTRRQMRRQLATQRAELVARGVSLDSPLAQQLGDQGARELSFASQSVRSRAGARSTELSASSRASRLRSSLSMMRGVASSAGRVITAAPDIWPSLAVGNAA